MRLFVVGNSHVASLKLGWEKINLAYPDIELTFFAHRGKRIRDFIVVDNKLVPTNDDLKAAIRFTSCGHEWISPASADAIFLCGMGLKVVRQRPLYYSSQVVRQATIDVFQRSSTAVILPMLREISDAPIFVGHDPLPAASESEGEYGQYADAVERMNQLVFSQFQAMLLAQPKETMFGGFATKNEFSINSSRLPIGKQNDGERHPKDDIYHMNDVYGRLYLEHLFQRMAGTTEAPLDSGRLSPTVIRYSE